MVKSPYTGDSIDSLAVINRLLISAPALNTLTMSDYSFTFNDLDTLSSVLPHLTSISLIDCTLLPDNKHASALIEPATSVTSLSLDSIEIYVRSLEIEAELLMYISKKYPNLSTITYNVLLCEKSYTLARPPTTTKFQFLYRDTAVTKVTFTEITQTLIEMFNSHTEFVESDYAITSPSNRVKQLYYSYFDISMPIEIIPMFTLLKIAHDFQSMYQNVILTTAINNETRRYTAECWSTMENQFKYLFGAHGTPMYPSVECSPNVDFDFKPYIRIRCYSVHDFIIIDHCVFFLPSTNGLRADLLYFTCSKKIKMTWPYLLHGPDYTCNEERGSLDYERIVV
ncbi:hypothetical protein K501DRAFT_269848 [Backusella circina FSU 941]|nr:hypothetical protein K501DRAFT_269848 [Backusella circina FSU 941]